MTGSWVAIAYLLVHALIILVGKYRPPRRGTIWAVDALLISAFAMLLLAAERLDAWGVRFLVYWSPLVFFWWAYKWAGCTLHSLYPPGFSFDPLMIRMEEHIGQPSLWITQSGSRFWTEIWHLFYTSYYFYTAVLAIYLYWNERLRDFEAMVLAVLLGYAVSYTMFSLVPVEGPRWGLLKAGLLDPRNQIPQGFWVTRFSNRIMYGGLAHKGGAMPSSHSSTAVVSAFWCWRLWGPEIGLLAAAIVIGMWVGSIHGRYHYVLDIVVGAIIGFISVLAADILIPQP